MGIITVLLFSSGMLQGEFHVPLWVVLSCHAAIALGTMFGGWRIVKTMGQKVAKLRPVDGFCAETSAAITLFISSTFGIPVSTTHDNRVDHGHRRYAASFRGPMGCRG